MVTTFMSCDQLYPCGSFFFLVRAIVWDNPALHFPRPPGTHKGAQQNDVPKARHAIVSLALTLTYVHDELVRARDEGEAVDVVELLRHVLPESVPRASEREQQVGVGVGVGVVDYSVVGVVGCWSLGRRKEG